MIVPGRLGTWGGTCSLCLCLLVAVIKTFRGPNDFDVYVDAGRRLLADRDLYAGSSVARGQGFLGPPAQALLFAPIAAVDTISASASRAIWAAVNVALLIYAIVTWVGVLTDAERTHPVTWRTRARMLLSRDTLLALLAVAHPLLVQFEHQNLNIVLLATSAYAADAIVRGRWRRGGVALGIAAAIKLYPAAMLAWLAVRGRGRTLAIGITTALALNLVPAVFSGTGSFLRQLIEWRELNGEGWPLRRANQSLVAMWGRFVVNEPANGYGILTCDQPLALTLAAVSSLVVIVPLLIAIRRGPASARTLAEELACVYALAVLLSPIAWEHYSLALFPAFVALQRRAREEKSRAAFIAFWLGLICITLLSRPVVGWHMARTLRALSLKTMGGLIVCGTLAALLRTSSTNAATAIAPRR